MWIALLVFLALLVGLLIVWRLSKAPSSGAQNTPSTAPKSSPTQLQPEPIPETPVPVKPLPLSPTQLPESLRDFRLNHFSDLDATKNKLCNSLLTELAFSLKRLNTYY